MKVLTVVAHPRVDSLTFLVANRFVDGLRDAGHETEVLDLHRCGFDPVMREVDEPDWGASRQTFSADVEREMERMRRHDALAYVFPLWWWGLPAMLKGYIDRVWNYGFAYGPQRLHHEHVLWLALAGVPLERIEKHRYDGMMERYFNMGLAEYVGIRSSRLELMYETIEPPKDCLDEWLERGYELGLKYGESVGAERR